MRSERYIVTELEGYLGATNRSQGLSVQVLDTAYNYRVVRTWRTEDGRGVGYGVRTRLRECAVAAVEALNRGEPIDQYHGAHGTVTAYAKGCRCELCKATKAAYAREWRKRRAV